MWLSKLYQGWLARPARVKRQPTRRRRGLRPTLEQLEHRTVPSNFTAASVSDLIADINAANAAGGSNTITLAAGTTFTLTAVNNNNDTGPTGLPVIAANDNLTIVGNSDVIQRSTAKSTPIFRLLEVVAGASLTLQDLTLQGGVATVENAGGGAIHNYGGTLTLSGVTVQNNQAGGLGANGGGIYSENGSLTLQNCTVRNNQAIGADGSDGQTGSDGHGGGIYIKGGTASLSNVTLSANSAKGGNGAKASVSHNGDGTGHGGVHVGPGNGGNGLGGGVYVASGSVTLLNTSMSNNSATGGKAGGSTASDGLGEGGGLYIDASASVALDTFTVANITNNTASTDYPNIYGSYSTL
jgi:hypothetical protein